MNKYSKIIFLLVIGLSIFLPASTFAAEIFFRAEKNSFTQNDEFLLQAFIDTKGESVNAIEGDIVFPPKALTVKEIRRGNSVVNFWIKEPVLDDGKITFSGITPGGLSGKNEFLFSIVFRAVGAGGINVGASELHILRNDGNGTLTKATVLPFRISIANSNSGASGVVILPQNDLEPPEVFSPFVGMDSAIFNGKYFLTFATEDKGSGIDHYEVKEGEWGKFVPATSPFVLSEQKLDKRIFVKAVDRAGNERIVAISAEHPTPWYQQYIFFVIIIVLIAGLTLKYKWPKFLK